jgi:hypothetical protein
MAKLPFQTSLESSNKTNQGERLMSRSVNALLAGAALAGLIAGTSASLQAQTSDSSAGSSQTSSHSKHVKEKHACKGQNSCKGKGGCKSSDNGCKGKNSCKGKGGCRTDGKAMPKE